MRKIDHQDFTHEAAQVEALRVLSLSTMLRVQRPAPSGRSAVAMCWNSFGLLKALSMRQRSLYKR